MKQALLVTLVIAAITCSGLAAGAFGKADLSRTEAKRSLVVIKELGSSQMTSDKSLLGHFSILIDGVIDDSGKSSIHPNQGAEKNVNGQKQTVVLGTDTLKSKKGTLVIGFRGVSIAVGNFDPTKDALDNESGTWQITSGTGAYKGWKGGGRWADVGTPSANYVEWDGYVTH